jgi:hypothetical protein
MKMFMIALTLIFAFQPFANAAAVSEDRMIVRSSASALYIEISSVDQTRRVFKICEVKPLTDPDCKILGRAEGYTVEELSLRYSTLAANERRAHVIMAATAAIGFAAGVLLAVSARGSGPDSLFRNPASRPLIIGASGVAAGWIGGTVGFYIVLATDGQALESSADSLAEAGLQKTTTVEVKEISRTIHALSYALMGI